MRAADRDVASGILHDNGIVVASLEAEPGLPDEPAVTVGGPRDASQSAWGDAGFQIAFDHVTRRYQAKRVRVSGPGAGEARRGAPDQLAEALERILRSQPPAAAAPARSPALEAEINRLAEGLRRIERSMATMSASVRSQPAGSPRRAPSGRRGRGRTHDEVLSEIFRSNLALMRGEDPASLSAGSGPAGG